MQKNKFTKDQPPEKTDKINFANYQNDQPLEIFDEFVINDIDPIECLKSGTCNGYSKFIALNGETSWRECEIISYNPETKKYMIRFFNTDIRKEVEKYSLCHFTNVFIRLIV